MRKNKIISAVLIVVLIISCVGCSNKTASNNTGNNNNTDIEYDTKIFDTSYVHTINIEISEEDWANLLQNPLDKTKYHANVCIDGDTVEDVSFATKGNTSLSSVASDSESDRYSFKINFGKYVEGQTYFGLNKLNLNNIYADATYMKDYLSYEIFRAAGVESPLVSYVYISINGEAFGLYLAIEEIGESYLDRTEAGEGELYKPETNQLGNMGNKGNMPDGAEMPDGFQMPEGTEMPDGFQMPEGMEKPDRTQTQDGDANQNMPNMPGGGFSSSNGASLIYTDDNVSSYTDIFDNTETDSDEEDWNRVIQALKALSEGNVEESIDVDEVIRYFVAHNFVLNYDSYTGNMLHNYYLYENDGKLSMLPWDYNLAFGAFSMGNSSDATSIINYGIDTPLSGATEDNRPMWSFILENEEYLELYHNIYNELIMNYFESGNFEAEMARVYEMIKPYVAKDPSAFYTEDEFNTGYNTLKNFCSLRAQSIRKQLDGTLPSSTDEQKSEDKIDASSISINDMGTQNQNKNGMGGNRFGEWQKQGENNTENTDNSKE